MIRVGFKEWCLIKVMSRWALLSVIIYYIYIGYPYDKSLVTFQKNFLTEELFVHKFFLCYIKQSDPKDPVFMRTIFAKYIGPFSFDLLHVSSSGSIKKHADQDLSSSYNSKMYFLILLLFCWYQWVPDYQGLLKSALSSLSNRSEKLLYMIWKMLALYICWHPVTCFQLNIFLRMSAR